MWNTHCLSGEQNPQCTHPDLCLLLLSCHLYGSFQLHSHSHARARMHTQTILSMEPRGDKALPVNLPQAPVPMLLLRALFKHLSPLFPNRQRPAPTLGYTVICSRSQPTSDSETQAPGPAPPPAPITGIYHSSKLNSYCGESEIYRAVEPLFPHSKPIPG